MTDLNIDQLVHTAVFGDGDAKAEARKTIHLEARRRGAVSSSIYPFYMAFGRSEIERAFTVPAFNIRALTYDAARALFRVAMRHDVGAFIFEIARSEIGYTEQRPAEYAACVLAAAIREGFKGPVFIQGDHFQASAKKWATPDGQAAEMKALESLIDEALAAEFYNIDIDTSTLVDLSKPNLDEQQRTNYERAAELTKFIRDREPDAVTASVGAEIGEVGGKNSDVDELRAFMEGYNRTLKKLGRSPGISKISVQTGTSHGGVVLPDGSIAKVQLDLQALKALSHDARAKYGLGGAVQHGASTLPADAFSQFPECEAVEIHLATNFQTIVMDHPALPKDLRREVNEWVKREAKEEWKKGDTEEQFIYKSRKKAIGPFKRRFWDLPADVRAAIGADLEKTFAFLFAQLRVKGTRAATDRYVQPKLVSHAAPRAALVSAPDDAEAGE